MSGESPDQPEDAQPNADESQPVGEGAPSPDAGATEEVSAAADAGGAETTGDVAAKEDAADATPGDGPSDAADGGAADDSLSQDDIDAALASVEGDSTEDAGEITEDVASGAPPEAPAEESVEAMEVPTEGPTPAQVTMDLPDFGSSSSSGRDAEGIALLNDVKLNVKIELGRSDMRIEDVLKLGEGSVVELDKLAGDPVDVLVNDRRVARGEVLVLNDNFCVRISEILIDDEEAVPAF